MEQINYEELDRKAKPGAFSTLDMEVLVPDVMKLKPGEVYLEIGVDKGKSLSVARMVAQDGVLVFGVDIKENPEIDGTYFLQGDSKEISKNWKHGEISVLFIDGDHSYEGCHADIEGWYPHVKKGGVMLFHDCDESSPGVMWAVSEFVCSCKFGGRFSLYKYNNKNTSMARIGP